MLLDVYPRETDDMRWSGVPSQTVRDRGGGAVGGGESHAEGRGSIRRRAVKKKGVLSVTVVYEV